MGAVTHHGRRLRLLTMIMGRLSKTSSAKLVPNLVLEVRPFFYVHQKINATTCWGLAGRFRDQRIIVSHDVLSARAEDSIPPRPQRLVHRHLPATADCQIWNFLQAGSSLHTWLGLAAHSRC